MLYLANFAWCLIVFLFAGAAGLEFNGKCVCVCVFRVHRLLKTPYRHSVVKKWCA